MSDQESAVLGQVSFCELSGVPALGRQAQVLKTAKQEHTSEDYWSHLQATWVPGAGDGGQTGRVSCMEPLKCRA